MVSLNTLRPAPGSRRAPKRLGRGTGSGQGCTAGHGNNGAKARSGDRYKPYFEGGQTPLTRRIGKKGFVRALRKRYQIVNIEAISRIESTEREIDPCWFYEKGLIRDKEGLVKILGSGDMKRSITIKAHAFSRAAREKIAKAKGKIEELQRA